MYNGNNNSYRSRISSRLSTVRPMYLYAGIAVLVIFALWFVSGFLRAGIEGYFSLAAGILLILGNLRDLIANPYAQRSNISLLNTLIGGGLVFYFLGRGGFPPIGGFWYIPAVLLVLLAAPLMIGRASVYTTYIGAATRATDGVRRVIGSFRTR